MVHVPRKGYVPGETVQVFAEIENHSRRQMKQTFVALVQVCSYMKQSFVDLFRYVVI